MDELWNKFEATGKVSDYIAYIRYKQNGEKNADNVKGTGSEGAKPR